MAKLRIVVGADAPVLRTVAVPVAKFDAKLRAFARDLKEAMLAAKGLGIAAPQVGESVRVFWVTLNHGTPQEMMVCMVNPEIVSHSAETEVAEEGCLSLPGQYGKVRRFSEVAVRFYDLRGGEQLLRLTGLDARVVQHEYDHLEGVLFIDKLATGKTEDLLM